MSSIAVLASVALSLAVQAQVAPGHPPGSVHVPGIVETPGSVRLPITVEVRSDGSGNSTYRRDLDDALDEIDRRRENGELTRREARQLRREAAMIDNLAERYGRDGLSDSELRDLEMHAQTLRSQAVVRAARPSPRQP